tara:strand:+ start:140 stop:457 length:318 start_codon:yes stop_codon:yes gene_type:complete
MIILKGTSFHQTTIKELTNWSLGTLRLEPENMYDPEACAVDVGDKTVGYLPKGWNIEHYGEDLLTHIKNNGLVSLRKVGGYTMNGGRTAFEGLRVITHSDLLEVR